MRRIPGGAVVAASGPPPAMATPSEPCTWKNVRIDGGRSVPGIVVDAGEKDLVQARTDIGGAYRWNRSAERSTPLPGRVGPDDPGHHGVLSIAPDPVGTGRVSVAAGRYTNDRNPGNGAFRRFTDKGNTWSKAMLPGKVGGSMPGRGMGGRLAPGPRDNRKVYFVTESGNGLRHSTDHGATRGKVADFPHAGDHVADPADPFGYLNKNQEPTWVTATRTGTAVPVVKAGHHGTRTPGASTTVGFLGGTTGTTNPVPSPITCTTP